MKDKGKRACERRQYEIALTELPLCCPPSGQRVWDAHPRVYLPIEETGQERCPYCGTLYVLKDFNRGDSEYTS